MNKPNQNIYAAKRRSEGFVFTIREDVCLLVMLSLSRANTTYTPDLTCLQSLRTSSLTKCGDKHSF